MATKCFTVCCEKNAKVNRASWKRGSTRCRGTAGGAACSPVACRPKVVEVEQSSVGNGRSRLSTVRATRGIDCVRRAPRGRARRLLPNPATNASQCVPSPQKLDRQTDNSGCKKTMDMGNQHPSVIRLQEIQRQVKDIGQQVCSFSGLPGDVDYRNMERSLTKYLFEIDSIETEGKADVQHARKRAAQEVEQLLKELEQNANHPSRLAINKIFKEAQQLVERETTPLNGGTCSVSDEFEEGIQDIVSRIVQVKTGGKNFLRKARYRTLVRVLAIQEIIESCMKKQMLALPLYNDAHPSVSKINSIMNDVNRARGSLISLLAGVHDSETYKHLSCVLIGLLADLDSLDVSGHTEVRNYRKEVVEEINSLLKHLDLEVEGERTSAYDLTRNESILKIEEIRNKMKQIKAELLKNPGSLSDFHSAPKIELQGLIAQLDEVSPGKNPCIREARRRAVVEVQAIITYIDLKEALEKRQTYVEEVPTEHPSHKAVWVVLGHLSVLQAEVLLFDGNRADKDYIRLEEFVTKQLLVLDAVDSQGDELSKQARKQAVKFANSILSYLDMKTDEWEY
ncbi:hypothetical protein NDU88_005512 [Pleurodeles waltl]|uniref:BAG family molecular chaperone regulator 5 n=1 Tax=Pleurodeles waltl TaxID=8319 RepID=A0AAV7MZK9_PLEWA|nr:hypothetical protein NDU88_005512 [Pleurodeles waltl]